ncbi:MAG: hypothetical protein ACM34E_14595, partial [Acidobacteriota bacterium]
MVGHPALNQPVAIQYPKLRAKLGKSVRYAQDKTAHLKTEFGFDTVRSRRIVMRLRSTTTSSKYRNPCGGGLSYRIPGGIEGRPHPRRSRGGLVRFAVSRLIPEMTQVALQTHKRELMRETPNFVKRKFLYRLS